MSVLVIDVAIPDITVFPGSWEQYESTSSIGASPFLDTSRVNLRS